jgi:hypothetical protein
MRANLMVLTVLVPLCAGSLMPADVFASESAPAVEHAIDSPSVSSILIDTNRAGERLAASLKDDCYLCKCEWDELLEVCMPGTVECVIAPPGHEESRVNCMHDMQGNECLIEQYELCPSGGGTNLLLVHLPGLLGAAETITEWTFSTPCSAVSQAIATIRGVQID